MLRDVVHRLRALLRRSTVERELDEELAFHIARQIDAHVGAGMSRDDARRRVRLEFGAPEQIKEECRDATGVRLLDDLWRDARYAVRTLRRSPAFTATAAVSIALGVGANTLVFSLVNGLVLRPLPITDPDGVVFVQRVGPFVSHSFPVYRDLRDRNTTFEGLAGYRITMMEVEANGRATHEWGYLATGNYFDLLGVAPAAGRFFHQTDDLAPGASPYAVLSHDYWRTRFAATPSVVGATIRINRRPYTVLGVAPPGFHGTEIFYRPDIWVPMMMQAQIEVGNPWLENRNTANTWVVGRLAPGVSIAQAEGDLRALSRQLAREHGSADDGPGMRLTRPGLAGDALGAPARAFALGVLALAGLVLATACVNLASTFAARGADRRRELAIRLSIGAGPGRISRQLLTESVVLAVMGGAAGSLGAFAAAATLSAWQLPIALPVRFDMNPDARVYAFAFLISLVSGVAFGVVPARQAARMDPHAGLKSAGGGRAGGWPVRDLFVAVQVALCVVLVTASLASLRSLRSVLAMRLGMDPAGVTMAGFDLGLGGYSRDAGEGLRRRALEIISGLPGVQGAAYANSLPLNIDQSSTTVFPEDRPDLQRAQAPRAIKYQMSPGFLRTLGIRLLQGRDVEWRDAPASPRVAVVNEAFARQILGGGDPLGRRFRYGVRGELVEVVGIVETGKYQSLIEPDTPAVFEPMLQAYNTTTVMLVRSTRPPAEVASDIRQAVASLDPSLPLFGVRGVDEMLGFVMLPPRAAALALGAFGVLAVMLAATGIHGIVAYAVARRRREIAIRLAIGATGRGILRLVLRRIGVAIGAGAVLGLGLALAAGGLLRAVVHHAPVNDAATLGAVGLIVALVGLAACWRPARRALRLDPSAALSVE